MTHCSLSDHKNDWERKTNLVKEFELKETCIFEFSSFGIEGCLREQGCGPPGMTNSQDG